jgi:nucleotide-binding universal stress UspA family protein
VKRVLLILSPSRLSTPCVDSALAAAQADGAELVVLFILDTSMPSGVGKQMADEGFLGEAPSGRLLMAMRRERKRQGVVRLAEVARRAEALGVPCRFELVEGEFVTRSLEAAQKEAAEVIFVAKRDRSALSRLVCRGAQGSRSLQGSHSRWKR